MIEKPNLNTEAPAPYKPVDTPDMAVLGNKFDIPPQKKEAFDRAQIDEIRRRAGLEPLPSLGTELSGSERQTFNRAQIDEIRIRAGLEPLPVSESVQPNVVSEESFAQEFNPIKVPGRSTPETTPTQEGVSLKPQKRGFLSRLFGSK